MPEKLETKHYALIGIVIIIFIGIIAGWGR